jgi:D-alanyl-D-alanine carboxypeptidase
MPIMSTNTSRWPTQAQVPQYYGSVGSIPSHLVNVPFPYPVFYGPYLVHSCMIHRLCADSLTRILAKIAAEYHYSITYAAYAVPKMTRDGVNQYDGTYNLRNKTNEATLSMHAFGIAIDFDAGHNPRGKPGRFKVDCPIVQAFEAEEWIWGGRWEGATCDPMHFQAARVR